MPELRFCHEVLRMERGPALLWDAYGDLVLSDERHNAPAPKIIKSRERKKREKKFLATHYRISTAAATCSNGNKLSSTTKNKVSVCAR